MCDSVYTTPQSVTSKKTPRRRAISPRTSRYSSPFQVVDLSNETQEELKNRLLESENVIQELRAERDALQGTLVDKAGLNESVIIERSNRVSTQETRIYRRDMTVLEDDLKQKQSQIRILQDKCSALEVEKQRMAETLKMTEDDKKENEEQLISLRNRVHELEKDKLSKTDEIYQMNGELRRMTKRLKGLSEEYNRTMAESSNEKRALEEKLEKFRNQLKESDRKSLEVNREQENTQKVLSEVRQLSDRLEYLTPVRKDPKKKEREEFLQLSAKVIEETMSDLKMKNARLEKELLVKKELVNSTKEELEALKQQMKAAMGDSDQATKFLQEENMKLTRQKADIRCDLLEARRELTGFDKKREELEKQRDEALSEVKRISELKKNVEKELESLTTLAAEREQKIEELQTKMAGLEVIKREHDSMKSELSKTHEKLNQLGKHLVMADQQCSHFKALKETAEGSRRRAIEQCNDMVVRIRGLEAQLENQRKVEQELEMLRAENSRQAQKIDYMKEEIQEVHLDYRQELSTIAQKKGEEKRNEEDAELLRLTLSKRDSELRSAKKTIEEVKADNQKVQQILEEVRLQQDKILEENVRLRKGMADALEKIEEFKRNWQNSLDKCERLERENADFEMKMNKMEEDLAEKSQQVTESEETIAYLHTQINAKQQNKQPKLGRRSTLLSTVSEMDTTVYMREAEEVRALEEQRQALMSNLAEKRRLLADSKKSQSTANTTTVVTSTTTSTEITKTSQSASELSHNRQGTMRHDIPHKWKEYRHLGVLSIKCSLCFVGIPTLGKARKCVHCDVHVHASCAPRVNNTCGMPVQCATYYQENNTNVSAVSEGRMNGWLRVYQDDMPGSTWIASWAMMDLTRIAFYTNDGADLDKPFLWIDLNQEQWVLRTGQEMPVDCDDSMRASNVLMIKMPRRSLYILAPSQPAAGRWAECLQTAQRKRMMLNSKPSSIAEFSCLLVLNSPNNLKIFKAVTIEDWILFATQTGLFFTSISQPRNPMRIAGPMSVTCLEIMSEINTVAMVVNKHRQLAVIPMDSLTLAMQSTQPSIRPEILPEFGHVHTIKYHQQAGGTGQRYLMISDDTHLYIRKYNATRDIFSQFAKINVPEPVTFVESAPHGIIYASDTFYYVPLDGHSTTPRQLTIPRNDYPVSAQLISQNEVLLAFQNHGVFVNLYGEMTRKSTIEWEKMPMEFIYTTPFLYIVHDDSIEILEVSESSEETVLDEREVFECVNAHIIGRQYQGVLISVSSKDSTEVHRFSTTTGHAKQRNMAKRRGASPGNTLKRTKN
ncbi:hypothetical protein CRE_09393 [Caenorhabditis remanei]|uniref:Phorbol-ester/DAG-type domain-containing protein n=1 Tax=Caenorhabditis remanei TaxID=31234 RepID=E3LIK8_CAERE|nr:hypothetical protein CRE_09393 [Caenorhabditis remanei]